MNLPVENPISAGRDVAPAARRLSAAMSGTLGDLVDGVAAFDRIVAWAPAGRATMIDEARRWSELTEHAAARRAHRPDTARRLAGHAPSFTRILIHPETGSVLSVGRTRCKVPKDLRDWLRVWDETWRFPGCNRNAANCDIDHSHDWDFGGPTSHDNLAHLCPAHHQLKHKTGWTVEHARDGILNWTSPTGHRYATEPETRIGPVPPF